MNMNSTLLFSLLLSLLFLQACGDKENPPAIPDGTWEELSGISNPPFAPRKGMVSFVIGDKAYVGLGVDENGLNKNDFYSFSPSSGWSALGSFIGGARAYAVGFSINGKGYVGTGRRVGNDINPDIYYDDFFEYDPNASSNKWREMESFPGGERFWAAGFAIDSLGYITTGQDEFANRYKDLWAYDPETDTWDDMADFPGDERILAAGMVIRGKAYVGSGVGGTDFWEYDPAINFWAEKANLPGGPRQGQVAFAIGNKGYIGLGRNDDGYLKDFYEYDSHADLWEQQLDFSSTGRSEAFSFAIGAEGFIGTGRDSMNIYSDCFKFLP